MFDAFPAAIATFGKLERLILRNARIEGGFEALAGASSLRMLDLSGMQLAEIPPAVFDLSGLEHLYFANNAATSSSILPVCRRSRTSTWIEPRSKRCLIPWAPSPRSAGSA